MAWPTLTVEIGTSSASDSFTLDDATDGKLDTGGTLGDDFGRTWVDITSAVRVEAGVTINRGSTRNAGPYFRYEAGALNLSLDNRDGEFDPFNLSGTHVSAGVTQLRPGLPIRVCATHNGATFKLFVGFVQSWTVTYPATPQVDSVVEVTAADGVAILQAADGLAQPSQGSTENAGERIGRILDNASWSASARVIDESGVEQLQPTELAQAAWTEALLTADSVNGYLYCDRFGRIVYATKSQFPRSSEVVFGSTGTPISAAEISNDLDQVFNAVKLARAEGNQQGGRDEDSIALFGLRGYERNDLVVINDYLVAESMEYILSQYSDWQLRVEGFTVAGRDTWTASQWQHMFELDMLRRVQSDYTTTDGRTISQDGLLRGLTLVVAPSSWTWSISTTQAPEALGTFTLDDGALGLLDTGTLAAF